MIDQKVTIELGTTALCLLCNGGGRLAGFPSVSIFPFLKSYLTEYDFDFRLKRSFIKYQYFKYNKDTGVLHLPSNILHYLETYFSSNGVVYEIIQLQPNASTRISLISSGLFEDRDEQTDAIEFLVDGQGCMKVLELQTGKGKSYIAARSIMQIGKRALVSVPASLVGQWNDALCSMCNVKIGIIRGSETIYDLARNNYESDVDIFLASVTTLQNYASGRDVYSEMPPIGEFLQKLQIGTKVVDECHVNFYAHTLVDIQSNIETNLYLSATVLRSSKNSAAIFKRIFPDTLKYGGISYDKYVNITECRYSIGEIPEKAYTTERGYSQFKFEKFILRSARKYSDFINRVLRPIIEAYYISKRSHGQKLLILVGLKDFADALVAWSRDMYPQLTSIAFLHKVDEEELVRSDIIVSTVGSCGTGKDIRGLRTMIMLTSFNSEALTLQTVGRLRKMEDTPEFISLVNTAVKPHMKHAKIRRDTYQFIAKKFEIVTCD